MTTTASTSVPSDRVRRWAIAGPQFHRALADDRSWFPGRWVGGFTLILGPVLMLTGALLRSPFHFFYPEQLAAYADHPNLIIAAYTCYALGAVALWGGAAALYRCISATHPLWALWGGALVTLGAFTRVYHHGTDIMVFVLAKSRGTEQAEQLVSAYYQEWTDMTWHPFRMLAGTIIIGWIVLAIGCWRSRTLTPLGAIALGLMAVMNLGTMKGTEVLTYVALGGLTVALVPLGVRMLFTGPPPTRRAILITLLLLAINVINMFFGPRG